jgi:hypothetical protein
MTSPQRHETSRAGRTPLPTKARIMVDMLLDEHPTPVFLLSCVVAFVGWLLGTLCLVALFGWFGL